nr:Na-translocating system protein MpsC family protein [Brevibacillus fulvus]
MGNFLAKLLRDTFGKGPESIHVSMGHAFIVIYIRNFLSPMERLLIEKDEEQTVHRTRELLMRGISSEIAAYIKIVTGMDVKELYYDWSFQNRTGVIIGISEQPVQNSTTTFADFPGKVQLLQEINRISIRAQKLPEEIYSYQLNPRTLIIVRNGILVSIEKELIRLGYDQILKIAKRLLEKKLLHNNSHFESILSVKVMDIFADWNFERDKSVIVMILNPSYPTGGNELDNLVEPDMSRNN